MGRLTENYRCLVWNLRTQKHWGSLRMMKEFPNKTWKRRTLDDLIKKIEVTIKQMSDTEGSLQQLGSRVADVRNQLEHVEEGGARVACGARVDGSLLYVIALA